MLILYGYIYYYYYDVVDDRNLNSRRRNVRLWQDESSPEAWYRNATAAVAASNHSPSSLNPAFLPRWLWLRRPSASMKFILVLQTRAHRRQSFRHVLTNPERNFNHASIDRPSAPSLNFQIWRVSRKATANEGLPSGTLSKFRDLRLHSQLIIDPRAQ